MNTESGTPAMVLYGPGCCIECGGELTVIDMETTFLVLNPSGSPMTEDTMIKCEGVCTHCGNRYPMMRNGLNYIHDNAYTRFVKEYNTVLHVKAVEERMDKLKPTDDNPFCIDVREGQD